MDNPKRILTLSAMLALLSVRSEAGASLFSDLSVFGLFDVAVKSAVLRESNPGLIHRGLAFSPDGNQLAVAGDGDEIDIWNWRKQHIEKILHKAHGASGSHSTDPIQFSPNGRMLAVCDTKGVGDVVIRIWSTDDWTILKDLTDSSPGGCNAMRFTPDGQFLIHAVARSGSPGDNLIAHATADWQVAWSLHFDRFEPESMDLDPNGRLAAVGGLLGVFPAGVADPLERLRGWRLKPTVYIVNLASRQIVRVIKPDAMGSLQWSPDGTRIALAGRLYIEIFEPRSGERLLHEKLEGSGDQDLRYTPDFRYLIESDLNGRGKGLGVQIWDFQHSRLRQKIAGDVGSIDVSRDGRWLAVGDTGRTTVWRIK
jgi:WD40 repeat protein